MIRFETPPSAGTGIAVVLAVALTSLAVAPARAAPGDPTPDLPPSPSLADLLRVAEARNPALAATRHDWRADRERIAAAGSFPDPRLTAGWFVESVETRVGPQEAKLSLRQSLPWPGTLGRRRGAAEAAAGVAESRFEAERAALRRDVTAAWFDLWWRTRAVAIGRESLGLLENLETIVREHYRVGRATHADLVRLQIEVARQDDLVRSREDAIRPARARLNALLDRPADAGIEAPVDRPAVAAAPTGGAAMILGNDAPSLRVRAAERVAADARRDAAARDRWPDPSVGVDWIRTGDALDPSLDDSGRDPILVSLSVSLPIFRGKHDGPLREAEARRAAAKRRADATTESLGARIEEVLHRWRDADRREELYAGWLVRKSAEAMDATLAAYRTGAASFLDLIDAQRTRFEMELETERARADRGRAAADLEGLTGRTWIPGGKS